MTTNEPLYLRLFRVPQLCELAGFISNGGRRDKDVKAKVGKIEPSIRARR